MLYRLTTFRGCSADEDVKKPLFVSKDFEQNKKLCKFVTVISIIQHIQYLIVCHDCVVVPGLGAFVAQHVPASISSDGCAILPPSRELSFNPLLTHDDGLLVNSITRREGVSYECGRSAVGREVELIHRRLRHEGTLVLDRIGTLTLSDHGRMEFIPVKVNGVVDLAYRGLFEVEARPLLVAEEPDQTVAIETVGRSVRGRFVGMMKYAASAVLLLGLGAVMMTPVSVPDNFSFASLNPTAPAVVVEGVMAGSDLPENMDNREIVLYRAGEDGMAEVVPEIEKPEITLPHRYYVIVASTSSIKEARRYVRRNSTKDHPLAILPSDGRYRVYAASGNEMSDMSAFRSVGRFAAMHPDAWIYTLK